MDTEGRSADSGSLESDVNDVIEIRDPEIDVDALMTRVRENVARRRAEGAYQEDLDAIARDVFAQALATPAAGRISPANPMPESSPQSSTLVELTSRWIVREVPFESHVRLFGPLIVAVRNFWNWMSAKWYVRAILQQQVGFNGLVARAFSEDASTLQALADEVRQLRVVAQQQQDQIARLEEEIERQRTQTLP